MNKRDEVLNDILSIKHNNILIELPTSFGKSRIAIELLKERKASKVLIVIPKNVLILNWKDEFKKWFPKCNAEIKFSTYVSVPKNKGEYDMVIFDEGHRLSERCREALHEYSIGSSIILSATVSPNFKDELRRTFNNLCCYKIETKEAIKDNVLPDPKVILVPLSLDNAKRTETLIINPGGKDNAITTYSNIWFARKDKLRKYTIAVTEQQYYNEISGMIDWYKKKRSIGYIKNKWLHACGERLRWLSDKKIPYTFKILAKLGKYRTLTFCGSIEQTEILGEYCINSKNKKRSQQYLSLFNRGKVSHITAASMLDEGVNLAECKIGIYNNLNSSERIRVQRLGRILRHKEPVIIIPYFKHTREEEIVEEMLADYNPELITTVSSIDEIDI